MISLFLAQVLSLNHFFAFYFNIHHLHSTNINVFPQLHAGIHASSSFCGLQKLVSDSAVQSSPTPVHISFTTVSQSDHSILKKSQTTAWESAATLLSSPWTSHQKVTHSLWVTDLQHTCRSCKMPLVCLS